MNNRLAKNRPSPQNEDEYIKVYKQQNLSAEKKGDKMDISAIVTKDGKKAHGLMHEKHNRSRDREMHNVKDVILDSKLKKKM